ncbi:MAG: hypothetical protein GEV03_24670 [Streptosporangiales bacterium]|nr:hypothetical protein [Streptosporangiales bacterium]
MPAHQGASIPASGLEALDQLRARLAELGVHAELREQLGCLAVRTSHPCVTVWVSVGYGGHDFVWWEANKRHPVRDIHGAAHAITDYAGGFPPDRWPP